MQLVDRDQSFAGRRGVQEGPPGGRGAGRRRRHGQGGGASLVLVPVLRGGQRPQAQRVDLDEAARVPLVVHAVLLERRNGLGQARAAEKGGRRGSGQSMQGAARSNIIKAAWPTAQ